MEDNNNKMDEYQSFIALSRYARWLPDEGRRETWEETVDRYKEFFSDRVPDDVGLLEEFNEAIEGIKDLKVMPSMRALMTAGKALDRDNIASFNCTYLAIDHPRAFDELMYILMNGVGVGFSVERQSIAKLPIVAESFYSTDTTIVVGDSKIGWSKAFKELVTLLYTGNIPKWDMSKVRGKGERLKTFGGRACLTGDTILYKDRKKSKEDNLITVKDLYDLENSLGFWKGKSNHFKSVKIRSLNEKTGEFYRNNVITVIDNGVCPVYEITTNNGYKIKATKDHRFMMETGEYQQVDRFKVGDMIAVNGSKEAKTGTCVDCCKPISRRSIRCNTCHNLNQRRDDALDTTVRQRKECRDYAKYFCERCSCEGVRMEVHHIDENVHNNSESNLENLCCLCHSREHAKRRTFPDPYSHKYVSYERIVSITPVGVDRVYDLQMEEPNHNFVANGFVSHNSGPQPLEDLFNFTVSLFSNAKGRKLTSIECHDLCCKIAEVIIVGGVRRSALISLSNLSDDRVRSAKSGQWWVDNPQRALSNNSVCYTEKPDFESFLKEWQSLYVSKSGERGVFSRVASKNQVKKNGRRDIDHEFGCNPCSEIILRPFQGCNLSEVVIRSDDNLKSLRNKVKMATILGTLQATVTNFRYLRPIWKRNTEEEALLGVSLTGIMDNLVMSGSLSHNDIIKFYKGSEVSGVGKYLGDILTDLKNVAISTNKRWASALGINQSTAITAVKPSGTVSQLVDSSSGIHARFSDYYIRTVRADKDDPLAKMMTDSGFPVEACAMKGDTTQVFSFPKSSPEESIKVKDQSAMGQLMIWKTYQDHWCEHKPSITVYYKDSEFLEIGQWLYNNFNNVSGISFLPHSDHTYVQAPYQEISKEVYENVLSSMPKDVDWSKLGNYEESDNTSGSQTMACTGSVCEIVDL